MYDESHFDKMVGAGLNALAEGPGGRGLFTSETADPNWSKAHKVLLPAFSMDAMRGYFPRMLDIALQLMQKWERLNSDDTVGSDMSLVLLLGPGQSRRPAGGALLRAAPGTRYAILA
jgi:cytochrome P450/NADPH-cytochrome P450 reductase